MQGKQENNKPCCCKSIFSLYFTFGQTCPIYCSSFDQTQGQGRCTSCETGYYLSNDACKYCTYIGTNCVTCSNDTHCDECMPGFWDKRCGTSCSVSCDTTTCSLLDGSCTCEQGFYGSTCQFPCSQNCLTDTCGPNGECGCKAGFYGSSCSGICFDTCEDCTEATTCSLCPHGRYGTLCGDSCQCSSRCDIVTGACMNKICPNKCIICVDSENCSECGQGWYGPKCNYMCSDKCNGECEHHSGNCKSCFPGYFGLKYVNECIYCRNSNCSQAGECTSCYEGKHGSFCNRTCSEDCVGNICNQIDGTCQHLVQCPNQCVNCTDNVTCTACEVSRYGLLCSLVCNSHCKDGHCAISSGRCKDCESSYYGDYCNNTCSRGCSTNGCERQTGTCGSYRIENVFGPFCNATCRIKYLCDQRNGYCKDGCIKNHYGSACNSTCSEKCANSIRNSICDLTGKCYSGCIDGFTSEKCITVMESSTKVSIELPTSNASYNRHLSDTIMLDGGLETGTDDDDDLEIDDETRVKGFRERNAYIASLGPMSKQMRDFGMFWNMILQQKVEKIVMVTNLMEEGKEKCEQYWPRVGITKNYSGVKVTCQGEDEYAEFTRRLLLLKYGESERQLHHLHFTAWPDRGIPEDVTALIEFRHRVLNSTAHLDGPTLEQYEFLHLALVHTLSFNCEQMTRKHMYMLRTQTKWQCKLFLHCRK
ncbi:PTPRF-like protein [Mya arenaria]|uniref:PTPRF-like protein n=1 Tax=Mya arenaria TaxID=6604 RepID=A0ABY7F2T1_MYAAR|nr:PTPRF-like protein [Mya arenaria]